MDLTKIKQNIKKLKHDEIPLVLINCGSFSPVTYLHLRIFEMARDYFINNNHNNNNNNNDNNVYRVVGGILSPVSDSYGKSSLVSAADRIEMCRLACESHPFVTIDSWETLKPEWTRTLNVLKHFDEEIRKDLECKNVKIMLIAGSDLVEGFQNPQIWEPASVQAILQDFGLVVIERNPEIPLQRQIFESNLLYPHRSNIFVVPQIVATELSSSKLRLMIKRGYSIKYLTFDSVIEYIEKRRLYH